MAHTSSAKNGSPKITIIGAGGFVFPFRLVGDILSFPALQASQLVLMDIDAERLEPITRATEELLAHHQLPATVTATTDRREALDGADVVVITFQVGGVEAYRHDVEIPRKYGIDQAVGDTLGPGGVFRFLRSVKSYDEIVDDALDLCPDALFINYANPMAMATRYLNDRGLECVGLCHSVQGTTRMLARQVGVPYEEVSYRCAGINHQSWVLDFRQGERDLYPELRAKMLAEQVPGRANQVAFVDSGDHSEDAGAGSDYEGTNEQVRTEIMRQFGFFQTESSHHASEYLPYFRKNAELVTSYIPQRWDYYEICANHDEEGDLSAQLASFKQKLEPSVEYGAVIINSLVTGVPSVIYGNVPNDLPLIHNLPTDACVEVPCLVDANGVQPTAIGRLPEQLAALNRTNINPQLLAVEAALTADAEMVVHAVSLDPLTGALLTLPEIRQMTAELFEAHRSFLPEELVADWDAHLAE